MLSSQALVELKNGDFYVLNIIYCKSQENEFTVNGGE